MRRRRVTLRPVGEEIARDADDAATRAHAPAMELFRRQAALGDVLDGGRRIEMTTHGHLVIAPAGAAAEGHCGLMSRRWAMARLIELSKEDNR